MLRFVKNCNGIDIYFDGDEESSDPSPKWVITIHPGCRIWLKGKLSIEEVEKFVENIWH